VPDGLYGSVRIADTDKYDVRYLSIESADLIPPTINLITCMATVMMTTAKPYHDDYADNHLFLIQPFAGA
jgi:hypothetical protein